MYPVALLLVFNEMIVETNKMCNRISCVLMSNTMLRTVLFLLGLACVSLYTSAQGVCGNNCGPSLVGNGDFSLGDGYFSTTMNNINNETDSGFGGCGGLYGIVTTAIPYSQQDHNQSTWTTSRDHTSGDGNFMIVDPPCTSDGVTFWWQVISVEPSKSYNFSAWISNLSPEANLPTVSLNVNGQQVGLPIVVTYDSANAWVQICGTYVNTVYSNVQVSLVIGASVDSILGSDIGVDDIEFYENVLTGGNTSSQITVEACEKYTVPSGNAFYTQSGKYRDVIPNSSGCDSIINIDLTINQSSQSTINVSTCQWYTVPSGYATYWESGTYQDIIPNFKGCDSLITINLEITEIGDTIDAIACNSYTSPHGYEFYQSGTYRYILINPDGCDSSITVNLTLLGSSYATVNIVDCQSYLSPSGKKYSISGTYTDTIPTTWGCDSIITINLTIAQSESSLTEIACNKYVMPSGRSITTSGTYTDTIQNTLGCDSIITVELTVIKVEAMIVKNDNQLVATQNGAMYQWLNCEQGFEGIPGANQQIFTPQESGSYAVDVSVASCKERSECITFLDATGLAETSPWSSLHIYPNPATDNFVAQVPKKLLGLAYVLSDLSGRLVLSGVVENEQTIISTQQLESGVYQFFIGSHVVKTVVVNR